MDKLDKFETKLKAGKNAVKDRIIICSICKGRGIEHSEFHLVEHTFPTRIEIGIRCSRCGIGKYYFSEMFNK
jgi:hypothetical protein